MFCARIADKEAEEHAELEEFKASPEYKIAQRMDKIARGEAISQLKSEGVLESDYEGEEEINFVGLVTGGAGGLAGLGGLAYALYRKRKKKIV